MSNKQFFIPRPQPTAPNSTNTNDPYNEEALDDVFFEHKHKFIVGKGQERTKKQSDLKIINLLESALPKSALRASSSLGNPRPSNLNLAPALPLTEKILKLSLGPEIVLEKPTRSAMTNDQTVEGNLNQTAETIHPSTKLVEPQIGSHHVKDTQSGESQPVIEEGEEVGESNPVKLSVPTVSELDEGKGKRRRGRPRKTDKNLGPKGKKAIEKTKPRKLRGQTLFTTTSQQELEKLGTKAGDMASREASKDSGSTGTSPDKHSTGDSIPKMETTQTKGKEPAIEEEFMSTSSDEESVEDVEKVDLVSPLTPEDLATLSVSGKGVITNYFPNTIISSLANVKPIPDISIVLTPYDQLRLTVMDQAYRIVVRKGNIADSMHLIYYLALDLHQGEQAPEKARAAAKIITSVGLLDLTYSIGRMTKVIILKGKNPIKPISEIKETYLKVVDVLIEKVPPVNTFLKLLGILARKGDDILRSYPVPSEVAYYELAGRFVNSKASPEVITSLKSLTCNVITYGEEEYLKAKTKKKTGLRSDMELGKGLETANLPVERGASSKPEKTKSINVPSSDIREKMAKKIAEMSSAKGTVAPKPVTGASQQNQLLSVRFERKDPFDFESLEIPKPKKAKLPSGRSTSKSLTQVNPSDISKMSKEEMASLLKNHMEMIQALTDQLNKPEGDHSGAPTLPASSLKKPTTLKPTSDRKERAQLMREMVGDTYSEQNLPAALKQVGVPSKRSLSDPSETNALLALNELAHINNDPTKVASRAMAAKKYLEGTEPEKYFCSGIENRLMDKRTRELIMKKIATVLPIKLRQEGVRGWTSRAQDILDNQVEEVHNISDSDMEGDDEDEASKGLVDF